MATLSELYNLRFGNADLRNRVIVAMADACKTILTEDVATANHEARLAWAKATLPNIDAVSGPFLWAVLLLAADPTTITDAAIKTTVNAVVNTFA